LEFGFQLGKCGKMKMGQLISKARKVLQGRSRGFSLIEVSIAIALIGVLAIAILGSLSYASTVLIITDRQATAESLAKSQMEYVKSQNYTSAPDGDVAPYNEIPGISIPVGYTIGSYNRDDEIIDNVVGIPWNSGNNTEAYYDTGLQKIKLVVKYEILRPEHKIVVEQFILEGYKRQPMT
jgi:prepilin-type N-terminal cleavage/methylation domain-containing protein